MDKKVYEPPYLEEIEIESEQLLTISGGKDEDTDLTPEDWNAKERSLWEIYG